jgi:hypothetical protein
MGCTMCTCWLWEQHSSHGSINVQLPCSLDFIMRSFFQVSTRPINDASTLFWSSPWLDGHIVEELPPDLFAMVSHRAHRSRMVAATLPNHAWIYDITRALTIPVLVQYLHLRQYLEGVLLQQDRLDKILWKWCESGSLSTSLAYKAMFIGQSSILGAKELWNMKALGKCCFFTWLLMLSHCWTSERL